MKCIINGKVILKDKVVEGLAVIYDKKIEKIAELKDININEYEVIDAQGNYVSPGLVDMHIHGYLGADVSDGDEEGLRLMCEGIIKNGVTAWCPTTMTVSKAEIEQALDTARKLRASDEYYGSRILGINSEGPFLNVAKKGAQNEAHILKPDADFICQNADIIKVYTIAPEVEGALECIKTVKEKTNVLASMGHTNATFEEGMAGMEAGVGHVTHLFNGMTGLSHRSPGAVGAALTADASIELIADTFHIDKGLFNLIWRIKKDKFCLITDCIRPGGMPDGDYFSGGLPVHKEGIKCLLPDGTICGSVITLNKAVYNLYRYSEMEIYDAVNCASLNPATALGEDKEIGSLEEGKRADIVIADEEFNILTTILGGEICYKGE